MSAPGTVWLLAAPLEGFPDNGPSSGPGSGLGFGRAAGDAGREALGAAEPAEGFGTPSAAELERAAAFTLPAVRERFLAGRRLLRVAGAAALGVPAARLSVASFCPRCGEGGHGAPALVDTLTGAVVASASLSRAAGWGVAAVAPPGWALGVDLVDPGDPAFDPGAPGYVGTAESWAIAEAEGKARGEGLVPAPAPAPAPETGPVLAVALTLGAAAGRGRHGVASPGEAAPDGARRTVSAAVVHPVPGTALLCALSVATPDGGALPGPAWLGTKELGLH